VIILSEQELQKRREIYTNTKLEDVEEFRMSNPLSIDFLSTLRIENLNSYFRSLKKSIESGHLPPNKFQLMNVLTLIDTTLLGSGAERVSGFPFLNLFSTPLAHLRLSRKSFTQAELQNSFYVLYTSEMETIVTGFRAFPGLQKSHLKKFPHAAKVFLLDTLELNSKSRCIFAWAGFISPQYYSYYLNIRQKLYNFPGSR
jgi:hypothetical protein